jgi:GTP-binding protein
MVHTQFVLSAASAKDFPATGIPEIALVGRSNVGKSSLINAIVKQKLARTSAAPGKTRLANYYLIGLQASGSGRQITGSRLPASGSSFYLVDLPGYGYARGGAASVEEFEQLTQEYFDEARHSIIAGVLQLIDARHPDLPQDAAAFTWLLQTQLPAAIVVSKIDKLNRADQAKVVSALARKYGVEVLPVSSVSGKGLDDLLKLIRRWRGR